MTNRDIPFSNVKLVEEDLSVIAPSCEIFRKSASDISQMLNKTCLDDSPGNIFMRMFFVLSTLGQTEMALGMQADALEHSSVYRVINPPAPKIRLLAIMGPGDMTDNTPVDFLLENSDIRLDLLFVTTEKNLPSAVPDHDLAFVALGESDKNNPILEKIEQMLLYWPRPYPNHPVNILNCARHKTSQLLQNIPGLVVPKTYRAHRKHLGIATFPVTIRPIDTHGGKGFEKIHDDSELQRYLDAHLADNEFYISEFIDYQSTDGGYRKLRIALIDRKPFICHLAISENWMVHYIPSGMELNEHKRAEEQAVMENFDQDFAARHRNALLAIADRLALDYVVLDCAETQNGELLLFEADPRAWIHATDPVDIFPYKPAVMQKAFDAFRALLLKVSRG